MSTRDSSVGDSEAWGSLSVFQRVMRQWADLHPYNAVHVFCLEGQADVERLAESIGLAWQSLDFGMVSIQKRRYRFSYPAGQSPVTAIDVVTAGENPAQTIDAHLTDLLNFRFPTRDYSPVRFSVIQEPTRHCLCVNYDHWIGDGTAMRTLLRPVIRRYCGDPGYQTPDAGAFRDDVRKISFHPPTYRTVYRRYFSTKMKRLVQWWLGLLPAHTTILVPSRRKESMREQYMSRELPGEALQRVSACAKQHGVTVHDVFLAAIARACMPFLPERLVRRQRRKMGIGSIVDARGAAEVDVTDVVGIYLGYFVTYCRSDQADSLGSLAQAIAKKTSVIKKEKTYLNTAIGMQIQCLLWPIIPPPARAAFMRNSVPLTAGITNTYIRDPWMLDLHQSSPRRLLSYFRAAPTGPILPISFAPTTMAGALHLGITWRPSCFDRETIEEIATRLENDLLRKGRQEPSSGSSCWR